jgi:hypothetical protein
MKQEKLDLCVNEMGAIRNTYAVLVVVPLEKPSLEYL